MRRKQVSTFWMVLALFALQTQNPAHAAGGWRQFVPVPVKLCYRVARQVVRNVTDRLDRVAGLEEVRIREQLKRVKEFPARSIEKDPNVKDFLDHHTVYISLTTSPERLRYVHYVLESLDLTYVTKILLVLPERFGRDGSSYEIPLEIANHPDITILRPKVDIGPASKMVPAIRYARSKDSDALVISIDDDHGYPRGMVNELILASVHAQKSSGGDAVVGGQGQAFSYWGIKTEQVRPTVFNVYPNLDLRPVDVVEGFAAIAYPVRIVDVDQIERLAGLSPECKTSDDLVISWSLTQQSISLYALHKSPYYSWRSLEGFAYGYRSDALHRGAGLDGPAPLFTHTHAAKYVAAYLQLTSQHATRENRAISSEAR